MPKVTILPHHEICPEGAEIELNEGDNLCQGLLEHNIKIEHACDMSKACTTCHVVVRKGFDSLDDMDDPNTPLITHQKIINTSYPTCLILYDISVLSMPPPPSDFWIS